ncbi:hypothetical protein ACFFX0_07500 [Citricoccus parietis]|uniref:Uncharacterized protein n=1 Tax=Citricoccus parietis TaxID=592307 RepID=A0ABV5FX85_9MICC
MRRSGSGCGAGPGPAGTTAAHHGDTPGRHPPRPVIRRLAAPEPPCRRGGKVRWWV